MESGSQTGAAAPGGAVAPPTSSSPGQQRARKRQKTTTTPPVLSPAAPVGASAGSSATSPTYAQSHVHGHLTHGHTPEESQLSPSASAGTDVAGRIVTGRSNAGSPRSVMPPGHDVHSHSRHSSGDGEAMMGLHREGSGGGNGGSNDKVHVKRACNECRQQKLRCDVVQNPYTTCSRCRRLKLECKIDANFKRTVKRSKIAEMEKELTELRQKLAAGSPPHGSLASPQAPPSASYSQHTFSPTAQISRDLLDVSASEMRGLNAGGTTQPEFDHGDAPRGPNNGATTQPERPPEGLQNGHSRGSVSKAKDIKTLDDVHLTSVQVEKLFEEYFTNYHPFLPFLDPDEAPSSYYDKSSLLFWAVISVASRRYTEEPTLLLRLSRAVSKLIWSTLAGVPHSKDVVKGMILLATWPFPTSSTLTDPTYMISCMAVSLAIQMGLHRPSHSKDYTKYISKARIGNVEVNDRTTTWACCNIASQSVSTGLGLPPHTQYDWTLLDSLNPDSKHTLSPSLKTYLRIQRFADEVTRALSANALDPIGLLDSGERRHVVAVLERRADEMEGELAPLTELHRIYLLCARLHLRAFHLFDEPNTPNYQSRILSLYAVATALVQHILQAETTSNNILSYCPFYVYQMFLSASFILLKVLHSSVFRPFIDYEVGRALFNQTITAIRRISVANNDLPGRLADVLAQLSTSSGSGVPAIGEGGRASSEPRGYGGSAPGSARSLEDKIGEDFQLRIRSRMSMSVVYDSLWKWREEFQSRSNYLQAREELGTHTNRDPTPSFDPNPRSSKAQTTFPIYPPLMTSAVTSQQPITTDIVSTTVGIPTTMLPMDLGRELTPILPLPATGPATLDMDMSPLLENDYLNMSWMLDGFEFLPMPVGNMPVMSMGMGMGMDPMKVDMGSEMGMH